MKTIANFFYHIIISLTGLVSGFNVYAGHTGTTNGHTGTNGNGQGWSGAIPNPLGVNTLEAVAERIADFLFVVGLPIAIIMVIWSGIMYMTAGGDEERLKKARKTLIWAAVGFAVIIIGKGFVLIIESILGVR